MRNAGRSALLALALGALLFAASAQAAPQAGWWWNPDESGRGFFIESHDGIFFMAAFLYADDGHARWLASGGPNADPYHWSGPLQSYAAGQSLFGPYVAPTAPADEGEISVTFDDDSHGTITWPGGTVPIQREIFDTTTAVFQPETGWWWNAAESGSGYSVEVQGGNLFAVGFMYETDGRPVWYFAAGPMSSPTHFEGPLLQFSGGQTLLGSYHPPAAPVAVTRVAIDFGATDEATLTLSDGTMVAASARPQGGRSRMIELTREFQPPKVTFKLPPRFDGNFEQHDVKTYTAFDGAAITVKTDITGKVTWLASGVACPTSGSGCGRYELASGVLHVHTEYAEDGVELSCKGTDDKDVNLAGQADSWLQAYTNSRYELFLWIHDDPTLKWTMSYQCTVQGETITIPNYYIQPEVLLPVNKPSVGGPIVYGVQGTQPQATVAGVLKRSGTWSFAANYSPAP